MLTNFEKVGKFHEKFDLITAQAPAKPSLPAPDVQEFRRKFMQEELDELQQAYEAGDLVKYADALADLVYVAYGTAHLAQIPLDGVFNIVHNANMKKVRASSADDERSKRAHALDVVKPLGWTPPDFEIALALATGYDDRKGADKWDRFYMRLAHFIAESLSKDPSTKVGAVVVGAGDRREVAFGYNGFPPGIEDREDRLNHRDTKYKLIEHAERAVLDNAAFDVRGATLYCTLPPCSGCAKGIISRKIARVVTTSLRGVREPWRAEAEFARSMFAEAGVQFLEVE